MVNMKIIEVKIELGEGSASRTVLDVCLSNLFTDLENWSSDLVIAASVELELALFNDHLLAWKSLIEPIIDEYGAVQSPSAITCETIQVSHPPVKSEEEDQNDDQVTSISVGWELENRWFRIDFSSLMMKKTRLKARTMPRVRGRKSDWIWRRTRRFSSVPNICWTWPSSKRLSIYFNVCWRCSVIPTKENLLRIPMKNNRFSPFSVTPVIRSPSNRPAASKWERRTSSRMSLSFSFSKTTKATKIPWLWKWTNRSTWLPSWTSGTMQTTSSSPDQRSPSVGEYQSDLTTSGGILSLSQSSTANTIARRIAAHSHEETTGHSQFDHQSHFPPLPTLLFT